MINDLSFPLDLAPCGVSQMLWVTMVHLFLIVLGVGETPSMAVHRPSRPPEKVGLTSGALGSNTINHGSVLKNGAQC
jgi:hypothetical protein